MKWLDELRDYVKMSFLLIVFHMCVRYLTKGNKMLEGKEAEGKIGNDGSYSLDVNEKGEVSIELAFEKDFGDAKVKTANSISVSIFTLLEKIAAKTSQTWDDNAVATVEKVLGIKK